MGDKEYIHRMLTYWDPWGLINNTGAPEDEYDSYIEEIINTINLSSSEKIYSNLEVIFSENGMPRDNLERALKGMTEGVIYLKHLKTYTTG